MDAGLVVKAVTGDLGNAGSSPGFVKNFLCCLMRSTFELKLRPIMGLLIGFPDM